MTKSEQVIKQNFSKTNGTPSAAKVGSNAPKATLEQLNLARLLTTNSDDRDRQFKLEQIQECTECDLEEAVLALHDADGNVQRAIENLIDAKRENDWQDTFTKRSKSKRHGAQKSLKMPNGKKSIKQAANGQSRNGPSNEAHGNRKASHSESTHVEGWGIECGEWKGEAIEVVNSAVNIPINIHDDTELLKLLTLESVETEKSDETVEQAEVVKDVEVKSAELKDVKKAPSKPQSEDQVKIVRDRLFKKYARSLTPPPSHVPSTPVFFAPGARNTALIENVPVPEGGTIQIQAINRDRSSGSDARVDRDADLPRSGQISKGKSLNNENSFDSHDHIKSPSQCNFSPAVNTLLHSVRNVQPNLQIDQTYATSLQNTSAHKEPYAKVQDHGSPHSRTQAHSVNNFEGSKSYSYNLLGDLPPTVKQVSLELQVGKSDAFTQSISSTQSENVVSAPYNMQTTKQSVGQPPQMNKPISTMPPNANQQSLPTNQPQLHHVMHPAFPTLLSHLQPNMSLFNFPGGSGPAAPPHLFDMDHFQALQQQQRMLFEMQQSQHPPQHTQTVANENNLPNSAADVISSTKSTVPMHQVTTANVGSGITFLPYSGGMVFMNGYPNAYLGQQQPQTGGSQNQSPGHGGSPLSHPSSQQQYPKSMNAPVNYAGYQGLRQSSFEDVGDILYSNLAKQMAYKHTSGVQSFYNPPMQQPSKAGSGPDLSLGGKLQQQAPGLPSAQQPQVPNAAPGVQPQALYTPQAPGQYPFFSQPCMAMAAAAAAAQNQQQSQGPPPPGTPGSNGVVPMHTRPTH
ncbi:unnamed protein product [Hydatigera taeniaeformis]|uniref:UBA domain-containing protein n=1 Tax=Hydatigena taeniaeformis TaxID=6205 RepID=A0A0R3X0P1_HYDTA|nr:unnamed protein product [Hydatigera taeniaeformis]